MKSKLLIIALTSVTSFALAADGDKKPKGDAPNPAKRAEMMLKNSDTDKNGSISKTEFANSKMGKAMTEKRGADAVGKAFTRIDKNKNGELEKGELAAMGAGKKGKGKGKPGAKKGDAKKPAAK